MAVTRQRSGDGSLGGDHRATFFRGAVEADAKGSPLKFPESLDLGFWEVRIFLEEDRFGGVEDGKEVVEVSFRHFEFQMLYIRGQKLELSSPIRQSEYRAEKVAISINDTVSQSVTVSHLRCRC